MSVSPIEPEAQDPEVYEEPQAPRTPARTALVEAPVPETPVKVDQMQSLLEGGSASVPIAGTQQSLHISRLVREGNTVRVWTDGGTDESPDYVIVNPPTEVITGHNTVKEDPLGAIAQAIHGAQR